MARKVDDIFILSAGEIGVYTVCPESWKLRLIDGKAGEKSENIQIGSELHNEWAQEHEEAFFYDKGIRTILILAALSVVIALVAIK